MSKTMSKTITLREGFWFSFKEKHFPMPVPREKTWLGQRVFISIQGKLDYEKLSNLWNRLPLTDRTNICVNIDYVINMLKEV